MNSKPKFKRELNYQCRLLNYNDKIDEVCLCPIGKSIVGSLSQIKSLYTRFSVTVEVAAMVKRRNAARKGARMKEDLETSKQIQVEK